MNSTRGHRRRQISRRRGRVMRQAFAGMLWSKQYYYFDVDKWLEERSAHPLPLPNATAAATRNGSTW